MAKRIYELDQSGRFSAFYLDDDNLDFLAFCESKPLDLNFTPRFEIEVKSTQLKNHYIIYTNATTVLVDKLLSDFLETKYSKEIQLIPIELICTDKSLLNTYFLLNTLHTESIVDEEKSEKRFVYDEYHLDSDNYVIKKDALKNIGIGRHNTTEASSYLFFSDKLILELHQQGFDKGFIFA